MDTVGKWRWVRKEASLLDGDLLLCFNGVVSVAAVIRRRASLPRWSSCALACLGVSSEMRQPSQAQQHHQNALLQTRLIFSLLRASSVKNTAPLSLWVFVHTLPFTPVYLSNTSVLSRWSSFWHHEVNTAPQLYVQWPNGISHAPY